MPGSAQFGMLLGVASRESIAMTQLPPEAQDEVAEWLLGELESERRWDTAFARFAGPLGLLADEALGEDRAGLTKPLVPAEL